MTLILLKRGLLVLIILVSIVVLNSPSYAYSTESFDWRTDGQPLGENFDTMAISANPQNFTMKQDKKGFIYVANGAGILIYNGNDWQVLSHGDQQVVFEFVLKDDGRIYTGIGGDLGYFESDKLGEWRFVSLIGETKTPEFSYVLHVLAVGEHVLYLTSSHLFHYDPENGLSWITEAFQPESIVYDGEQILISSSSQEKMFSYSLNDKRLVKQPDFEQLNVPFFNNMLPLMNGQLLLTSVTKLFLRTSDSVDVFQTEIDDWLAKNMINDVEMVGKNRIVIASRYSGIAIINLKGELIRFYNTNHGLKDNQANSLLIDRENNIWISHATNGISRVELNSPISQYSDEKNFAVNTSVVEFKNQILVGAFGGLFKLKHADEPSLQAHFVKVESNLDLIFSFLIDQNELLIGHVLGVEALSIDQQGNMNFSRVHDSSHFNGRDVRKLIRSNLDSNVVYGVTVNGLIKLEKKQGKWESIGLLPNFKQDLYSIVQGKAGMLWLGTIGGSFFKVSEVTNWPHVKIEKANFPQPNKPTSAMAFRLGENILLSNSEGKIQTPNDSGNNFVAANFVDWKENNITQINILQQNNKEEVWLSARKDHTGTNQIGLLKPTKKDKYTADFSPLEQLKLEFVQDLYSANNDDLWVNSRGRIVRYRTTQLQDEHFLQAPTLTKVIELGSDKNLFTNNRFEFNTPTINLAADENSVRVHFSGVNYRNNNTLEYRYRLVGKNQLWSDWSPRTTAEFTNLNPGNFVLELQYKTNVANLSPISRINFQHAFYWHQLLWVRAIALLLLIISFAGFAVIYARFRNRRLNFQAENLENQVVERTSVIRQQNKQLLDMEQAKDRFFANVSHEFRTPLTLAIGPLKELITSKHIQHPQDQEYLKMALNNNIHMMDLVGQILDLNRLEAGGMPIQIVKLDLVATLKYGIQRFDLQAKKQQIKFQTVGFEENIEIYFDADHFEKIILNLISNAVKYSPPKSTIEIGIATVADKITIWVKDQGEGISSKDQESIFNRFYQGRNSSHTLQPGTGIGLALIKELLSLHQGQIKVNSQLGKGAQFTVTLISGFKHYDVEQMADSGVREEEQGLLKSDESFQSVEPVETQSRKNILIVDDNPELRQFIRTLLQATYCVTEASDGQEAFQNVIDCQPDLIVSDIMMPVMDGLELAEKLKSTIETAHIPLILLTAKSTKREIIGGLQQGADDYLSKPFDSAELAARIAAQLSQKQRIADELYRKYNIQKKTFNEQDDENDKFTLRLNALLDEKLSDPEFNIEYMCEAMNSSRSTLFRQIKNRFNCTPKQLLRDRRLEIALNMLQRDIGTVSEVAYAVGFQSVSTFSKAFSERFNVPPTRISEIKNGE